MRSLCPRIRDMGSPISMRPVGHLSRNLSAWNNSRNRSPLRYERKHLRPWPATARGSRPVLMFCRDAKAQSFSARHSGCGSWVRGFWPVIGIRNAGDLWRQCQGIQSRVLVPDRDIHGCRGNQTRLLVSPLCRAARSCCFAGSFPPRGSNRTPSPVAEPLRFTLVGGVRAA